MRHAVVSLPIVLALLVSGCGSSTHAAPRSGAGRLRVGATVAPIVDIVREVVGDRVVLTGLIPEGVDSHTFEPSPATARTLAQVDVLFMDGLHLEGSTLDQARANMPHPVTRLTSPAAGATPGGKGSEVVALGDLTLRPSDYAYDFTFPKSKGDPNPHLWMDPTFARRWSEIVRDVMTRRDPTGAPTYSANQRRFADVLDRLDRAVAASIGSIPVGRRKLLTYHDSFAYFSRRYGIPVLGAVQPSDFSEPSPKEVRDLIAQVEAAHVPAVFGSEVFPSTVLAQVAREAHAAYVDKLHDDELPGPPSAPGHTYVGLMVDDVRVITQALGGDASPLASVPTARTWPS